MDLREEGKKIERRLLRAKSSNVIQSSCSILYNYYSK